MTQPHTIEVNHPDAGMGIGPTHRAAAGVATARVAVILVYYHQTTAADLAGCYASLRAQTYPQALTELFIVDNQSTPHSQAWIEQAAPAARRLASPDNLGWGAGNNLAIHVALEQRVDYFVFVNVDTVLDPDWLARLVDAADRNPALDILQSKIVLHGQHRIHSLGNRIHFLGYGYCLGYGQPDYEVTVTSYAVPGKIDFASGAAMLVRRELFERVGLFCEDYFLYYDDLEFCWRARLAGARLGLVPDSICAHRYAFAQTLQFLYYLDRNRLLTLLTLPRKRSVLVIAPCLAIAELALTVYYARRGWGRVRWDVVRYFLRASTWRWIAQRRRHIARLRAVDDAGIVAQFAGQIQFAEIDNRLFRRLLNPMLWLYWSLARHLIRW